MEVQHKNMCSKYWILFLLFGLLSYNNNKGLNSVLCQSTKSNQMSYYFTPICMFISIFACLKTMTIQSLQQEVLKIQLFYIRASILSLQYVSHMYFHIFCQTFSSHSKNSLCRGFLKNRHPCFELSHSVESSLRSLSTM